MSDLTTTTPNATTTAPGMIQLAGDLGGTAAAPTLSITSVCDGRLTLTSGTPVTTADVTAAGTIYFTPYKGNRIALYDGSAWALYTLTERSLALTLTSANVYDVFIYNNAGTLTLETLIWTNATTRATALVFQDGVYVKSGATTRRYLGTIYASGTNTTEDSITKRYVWNYYNRVPRKMFAAETTASWAYTTAAYRASNNTSVVRLNMVIGVSEDVVAASTYALNQQATTLAGTLVSIGLDSTTVAITGFQIYIYVAVVDKLLQGYGNVGVYPGIGFHYLQQLEYGAGVGTTTWYASSGAYGGISATVLA